MSCSKINLGTGEKRYRFLYDVKAVPAIEPGRCFVNSGSFSDAVSVFVDIFPDFEVLSVIKMGAKK